VFMCASPRVTPGRSRTEPRESRYFSLYEKWRFFCKKPRHSPQHGRDYEYDAARLEAKIEARRVNRSRGGGSGSLDLAHRVRQTDSITDDHSRTLSCPSCSWSTFHDVPRKIPHRSLVGYGAGRDALGTRPRADVGLQPTPLRSACVRGATVPRYTGRCPTSPAAPSVGSSCLPTSIPVLYVRLVAAAAARL
jgi:hypothetical protein